MHSRTESTDSRYQYSCIGDNVIILDEPLRKYLVDFGEDIQLIEATKMVTTDQGVCFENVIIRGKDGVRIGIGRTFIEHNGLVGVTLIEQEFGGMSIDNDTLLSLFGIVQPEVEMNGE